jgi:hypothetical protein
LLLLLGILTLIRGQNVDSIKVEQTGDYIKIQYKILNSTPNQKYSVKVLCSINGGLNSEIRSVSGDVGDLVVGGKPEYWVVWDVLKDVDELKSVEFIVRAELISDETKNSLKKINWSDKKMHILVTGDYSEDAKLIGLRLGYMGNWGVSARIAIGKVTNNHILGSEGTDVQVTHLNTSLDLTKRIVNKNKVQIHYLIGPSYCKVREWSESGSGDVYDMLLGGDTGLIMDIKRLCLSFGVSFVFPSSFYKKVSTDYNFKAGYLSAGIGMRF